MVDQGVHHTLLLKLMPMMLMIFLDYAMTITMMMTVTKEASLSHDKATWGLGNEYKVRRLLTISNRGSGDDNDNDDEYDDNDYDDEEYHDDNL